MSEDLESPARGVVAEVLADGSCRVELEGVMRTCRTGSILRRAGVKVSEGDRVAVVPGTESGWEIIGVRRWEPARKPVAREARVSLISQAGASALRPADQRVDHSVHPDWCTGVAREARTGDEAYCTAGPATVRRVLGRTGDGSRLLELRLSGQAGSSFYAAASNVLLAPRGDVLAGHGADSLVIG